MQTFIDEEKNPLFSCRLCPRNCGINRYEKKGFCLAGSEMVLSKIDFHKWEEPCICKGKGVGAFFFSGCSLHCCFCQNNAISSVLKGDIYSEDELAEKIGTINYEIVCLIGKRVPRIYSRGNAIEGKVIYL